MLNISNKVLTVSYQVSMKMQANEVHRKVQVASSKVC